MPNITPIQPIQSNGAAGTSNTLNGLGIIHPATVLSNQPYGLRTAPSQPMNFVSQAPLQASDVVAAITQGLAQQSTAYIGGASANVFSTPSNVIVTQSGSTTSTQKGIINSDIWGAMNGTVTYSDGVSGSLTNAVIAQLAGNLYLRGMSVEAQNSSGTQDASAIASLGLLVTTYNLDGAILTQNQISTELSPAYYQSGTLTFDFTNAQNPYGFAISRGTQISFVPVAGDKYTFILKWAVA
ncbi:MAG TPA: hypothetical protein VK890_08660 [Bacteroidia bacterium]|jgi:hypothetical protein|nr:hypothetical protein [Bacteroidia bacterium]